MKSALVTGGSRGIGRAICIKMAGLGYHVLVNYKGNKAAAEETLEAIKTAGSTGELLAFDVADKEQIKTVLGGWI
ncbi:SDR family NAD(P)-dependent oxidoreductase, partial [Flavihumibacter sediminis]|nr:SDR family NAD(P)-dependent oxidoreductase [Flavihumibacter sediminis]